MPATVHIVRRVVPPGIVPPGYLQVQVIATYAIDDERIMTVAAEDRTLTVLAEDRSLVAVAEDRTLVVPTEDRSLGL